MIREVDALDGLAGRIIDKAAVQFRVLNKKKGPAVWGPRAQIDRTLYKRYMQEELTGYPNLSILLGSVADIVVQREAFEGAEGHGRITGVKLETGEVIPTSQVVITTGTFLGGEIHIGMPSLKSPGLRSWLNRYRFSGTPSWKDGRSRYFRPQQVPPRRRLQARSAQDRDSSTAERKDD